jgi:hypothetical protein
MVVAAIRSRSGTSDCRTVATTSPMLAIIVPYRNRPDHLFAFLPWMRRYFADRTDISFHIIEQLGEGPFNRGRLCNAGYLLVRDQIGWVCFHDVDFLPVKADYSYPVRPARLVLPERMITSTLGYRENQDAFFGAVVVFNNRDFEKINGFPNVYAGWGPEDRELGLRCQLSGLGFDRRDGEFRCLPHLHVGMNADGSYNETAQRNWDLFETRQPKLADIMAREGLSDCRFRLIRSSDIEANGAKIVGARHWLVDIAPPNR